MTFHGTRLEKHQFTLVGLSHPGISVEWSKKTTKARTIDTPVFNRVNSQNDWPENRERKAETEDSDCHGFYVTGKGRNYTTGWQMNSQEEKSKVQPLPKGPAEEGSCSLEQREEQDQAWGSPRQERAQWKKQPKSCLQPGSYEDISARPRFQTLLGLTCFWSDWVETQKTLSSSYTSLTEHSPNEVRTTKYWGKDSREHDYKKSNWRAGW